MSSLPPQDILALKVSLPVAQEAGKPFDPPLLVSAIGKSYPDDSDDLYLARITLVQIDGFPIPRVKEETETVLEGNLEVGLTTAMDGMLFFLFNQLAPGSSKPLQLARRTTGRCYRFAIQVFACRLQRHHLGDYWGAGRVVGEVLTDQIASVSCPTIRSNPAMVGPDSQLSEAVAGMGFTNPSWDVQEMKRRHPTRGRHPDTAKGPWRTMGKSS